MKTLKVTGSQEPKMYEIEYDLSKDVRFNFSFAPEAVMSSKLPRGENAPSKFRDLREGCGKRGMKISHDDRSVHAWELSIYENKPTEGWRHFGKFRWRRHGNAQNGAGARGRARDY